MREASFEEEEVMKEQLLYSAFWQTFINEKYVFYVIFIVLYVQRDVKDVSWNLLFSLLYNRYIGNNITYNIYV